MEADFCGGRTSDGKINRNRVLFYDYRRLSLAVVLVALRLRVQDCSADWGLLAVYTPKHRRGIDGEKNGGVKHRLRPDWHMAG